MRFRAILCLIILFALAGSARAEDHPAIQAAAASARLNQWSKALASVNAIGGAGAEDRARALFLSGYCLYQLERYSEAIPKLKEASNLHPALSFHGLFFGAAAVNASGDPTTAVGLFERLLQANPPGDLRERALMELMRIHRKGDNPAAAEESINRLRALPRREPTYSLETDYTQAWVHARQGDLTRARPIFLRLWKEEPDSFWADQAGAMLAPGGLCPEPGGISERDRLDRVRVLIKYGMGSEAVAELNPLVAAAETGSPSARLAVLYKLRAEASMKKRAYDEALADLGRAQAILPSEDYEITYNIASAHDRAGRDDEALARYRDIWERTPRSAFASRSLYYGARIFKEKNDWAGAEAAFRKLNAEYPNSSFRPEALFQLAWMKYLQKDYQTALECLDQSPLKNGEDEFNARTLYWRAVLLRQAGQPARAAEVEDYLLRNYWKTHYAFLLVMVHGRPWHPAASDRPLPPTADSTPMEFKLAEELSRLGLMKEADGQLMWLERAGRLSDQMAMSISLLYLEVDDYYRSQLVAKKLLNGRLNTPPPAEIAAWRIAYPRAFRKEVETYAAQFGLDPLLVYSLMRAESTYRPTIKSRAGALGLMQVMPETGRGIARGLGEKGYNKSWLLNPDTNVRYGCYYLSNRLNQFALGAEREQKLMTMVRALASYNAGPERVKRWAARTDEMGLDAAAFMEEVPIKETREYVKRILGFYFIYLNAYRNEPAQ